jgi:hypothetical protein
MFKNNINDRNIGSLEFTKKEKAALELLKIFFIRTFMLIHFRSDKLIKIEINILNFAIIGMPSQSENKQIINSP